MHGKDISMAEAMQVPGIRRVYKTWEGIEKASGDMALTECNRTDHPSGTYTIWRVWSVDGPRRCTYVVGQRQCVIPSRGLPLCPLHAHRAVAEPMLVTVLLVLKKRSDRADRDFYTLLRNWKMSDQRDFLNSCLWF
ncbi:hypothetical protein WJX74_006313 [Apatococcus lobatus]